MHKKSITTEDKSYTDRLVNLSGSSWKKKLKIQKIYTMKILAQNPGKTLDIGCGIGRHLKYLSSDSVGIDHNPHSIKIAKALGLNVYTTSDFKDSINYKKESYNTILMSHVLEHLSPKESIEMINEYKNLLCFGGKVIVCCPQPKGYKSDYTHKTYMDREMIVDILKQANIIEDKYYSFPLPSIFGKYFTYNEHIVTGHKR